MSETSNGSWSDPGPWTGPAYPAARDPLYIVIPITVLYSAIFVSGVVGNVVTCVVIARNRHMRTATNYYLFSLAVSDLLLLVSGLPQEMHLMWSRQPLGEAFGEAFCIARGLASETSGNATVLTITAFSVERYVAVCHPFAAHGVSRPARAVKLVLAAWAGALAFAVPQALQLRLWGPPGRRLCIPAIVVVKHSFEISTFLFFVAPMTLITVLYALIGLRLRRTARSGLAKRGPAHPHSHASRRVLKMLVAVVVAFFVCWAPFHAQRLLATYGAAAFDAGPDGSPPGAALLTVYAVTTYVSGVLYYFSTTVNPILYQIMSHKFREAFKDTLGRCCGLRSSSAGAGAGSVGPGTAAGGRRRARGRGGGGGGAVEGEGDSEERPYRLLRRPALRARPHPPSAPVAAAAATHAAADAPAPEDPPRAAADARATQIPSKGLHAVFPRGFLESSSVSDEDKASDYPLSVVLSTRHEDESHTSGAIVPSFTRQSTRNSQRPFFPSQISISEKKFGVLNTPKRHFWRILSCVSSSDDTKESYKHRAIAYSATVIVEDVIVRPLEETLHTTARSISNKSLNSVSNSSLKDVERGALEDELTLYMQELRQREQS